MKPRTTAVSHGGPIRLPPPEITDEVTAEAELGVVIGRECSDIETREADSVVAGFVPILDMTAEDILRRNPRFLTRSKSFDSFLVIGPWITTTPSIDSLTDVAVRTKRNGEVVAENVVANMCMQPAELVAFHSKVMTLEPGDVISTGTPGAVRIEPRDTVSATIDRVGSTSASVIRP